MTSRRLVLFMLAGLASLPFSLRPAAAQDIAQEASVFVRDMGDKAISAITDKSLDDGTRKQRFRDLFLVGFDVPAIGRFVLGRYWRSASDAEKDEFMAVFTNMVVQTYGTRFSEYAGEVFKPGETFKILGSRNEGDNHAIVNSQVVRPTGGAPIRVEWRVLKPQGQLKVVDVIIEGVSMSVTQQQEFTSVIQRNGGQVGDLIAQLKARYGRTG